MNHRYTSAWVTGGSKGIGRSLVEALSSQSNQVFVSARQSQELQDATAEDHVHSVPFDATDQQTIVAAQRRVAQQTDSLDLLVVNAGICEYFDSHSLSSEVAERVMQVNYIASVQLIEAALPLLRAAVRRGRKPVISVISSSIVFLPLPKSAAYAASKAALTQFCEALRYDLANEGIELQLVFPGFVETPLTDKNDFDMPFRITSQDAARRILRGLVKGTANLQFPKRFTFWLVIIDSLPAALKSWLLRKMSPIKNLKRDDHDEQT
ncbi:SDR family NAD(P)-dependent oxidoreductase [uncultured Umboniibacter sp.]|uniref:SDR family NAD(P)-dependent oxidoreductase n=1 Tax=uncultured Umboniibacter sp. TaxID=1798917 RepID=UPI002609E5D5|nr:SDR family NAD(P)-dependent oxidoreductase [uncultured Umboniibacter sp.]